MAWHPRQALLAVASNQANRASEVNVFGEDGKLSASPPSQMSQKPQTITTLSWHPDNGTLAVGYQNGDILVWCIESNVANVVGNGLQGKVVWLGWNVHGSKLILAGGNGDLLIYRVDNKGRPHQEPSAQHKLQQQIVKLILKPPVWDPFLVPSLHLGDGPEPAIRTPTPEPDDVFSSLFRQKYMKENRRRSSTLNAGEGAEPERQVDSRERRRAEPNKGPNANESTIFFVAGGGGSVWYLSDSGIKIECFTVDKTIVDIFYYSDREYLLTLTGDLFLYQHYVPPDLQLEEKLKVKLSGKVGSFSAIFMDCGMLAMSSGENHLRLWDLSNDDNCILNLEESKGYTNNDAIQSIAYCSKRGVLAAGTSSGLVAMWHRRVQAANADDLQQQWRLQTPTQVGRQVIGSTWAQHNCVLAVATVDSVFVIREQIMQRHFDGNLVAIQTSRTGVAVLNVQQEAGGAWLLRADLPAVRGLCCYGASSDTANAAAANGTGGTVAVWDGKTVHVYEMVAGVTDAPLIGAFQADPKNLCLHQMNVYCLEGDRILVRTFQGTTKQILSIPEAEGRPVSIACNGNFLAVGTSTSHATLFDLSHREARQQYHAKRMGENMTDSVSVDSVHVNCNGTKISAILKHSDHSINSRLFVWDAETDNVNYFSFSSGLSDQQENERAQSQSASNSKDKMNSRALSYRFPISHYWDKNDNRLLVCEAQTTGRTPFFGSAPVVVATFFVTSDMGIMLRDVFDRSQRCDALIGINAPFLYFTSKAGGDASEGLAAQTGAPGYADAEAEQQLGAHLVRRTMREFIGMTDGATVDRATRDAMLNFSYFMTVGNMDEAFKAIKLIKSESVWENLAHMCVKSQRLDVAMVCLGNMRHARGARALRQSIKRGDPPDVQVATLAVHLGLVDDAAALYRNNKRFDLLNKLYQTTNNWKKAFEISQRDDRIHLRNCHYRYAGHLESIGAIDSAIDQHRARHYSTPIHHLAKNCANKTRSYEKSDSHRYEVPRMLFDEPAILEQYVKRKRDPYLLKWWAQYLESLGEMEAARDYYKAAKDYLSVVRICCYLGDVEQASAVASESSDRAACYHLARQYESSGQISAAVRFYTKAHAFSSAIRLAKEHELDDRLAQLALQAGHADMIDAAQYYEQRPNQAAKAVMLYHKAGMFGRAMELAHATEQFSALDLIAADLDDKADPRVLERCAEFFQGNQQHHRAAMLLAMARKYPEALELCTSKNVPLDDQLVERLTPNKESMPDTMQRNKMLERLADLCLQQGLYHLAAKKFTQAGSKVEAMRALLKSGDTDKIVFFASTARSPDIYVMAGNYLQTTDWKENPDVMRHIVTFYTKGNAPDSLASFYDACAQVEIDDYRDYEKAASALQEAVKCLKSAQQKQLEPSQSESGGKRRGGRAATTCVKSDVAKMEQRAEEIHRKLALIKKFLNIRTIYEADPAEAMQQLQTLAREPDVNDAVRLGDIYAVLIIHNVKKDNFKKAYTYVQELRNRMPKLDPARYVKQPILDNIYRHVNVDPQEQFGEHEQPEEQDGGDAEEAVEESFALRRQRAEDMFDNDEN